MGKDISITILIQTGGSHEEHQFTMDSVRKVARIYNFQFLVLKEDETLTKEQIKGDYILLLYDGDKLREDGVRLSTNMLTKAKVRPQVLWQNRSSTGNKAFCWESESILNEADNYPTATCEILWDKKYLSEVLELAAIPLKMERDFALAKKMLQIKDYMRGYGVQWSNVRKFSKKEQKLPNEVYDHVLGVWSEELVKYSQEIYEEEISFVSKFLLCEVGNALTASRDIPEEEALSSEEREHFLAFVSKMLQTHSDYNNLRARTNYTQRLYFLSLKYGEDIREQFKCRRGQLKYKNLLVVDFNSYPFLTNLLIGENKISFDIELPKNSDIVLKYSFGEEYKNFPEPLEVEELAYFDIVVVEKNHYELPVRTNYELDHLNFEFSFRSIYKVYRDEKLEDM